jgi:archaellum component FlaC
LSGEIEKLKYELSDTIDARFEHITKNIEGQTKALATTYEELSESLKNTS